MAQHIPIKNAKQKIFKKIESAIKRDFENSYPCLKTSFKYNFDETLSVLYRENKNEEVYSCNRYIGKGFVWGDTRGDFEIHFDKETRKVNEIYLVA